MDPSSSIDRIIEEVKRLPRVRDVRGEREGWLGEAGRNFSAVNPFYTKLSWWIRVVIHLSKHVQHRK